MKYLLILSLILIPVSTSAASLYGTGSAVVDVSTGRTTGVEGAASTSVDGSGHDDTATSSDETTVAEDTAVVGLHTNALGITIQAASEVETDEDLTVFTENAMVTNEHITNVDTTETGSVTVTYRHAGKLFGFIPVSVPSRTRVTTDGNGEVKVDTSMPWWNFLVSGTAQIKAAVEERLASSTRLEADVKMSAEASTRAAIVEEIIAALNASATAEASGTVN